MGQRAAMQAALFHRSSMDRHVPADRLLRAIDRFVDCPVSELTFVNSTGPLAAPRSIPS